jgi:chemotaxis protein methyltransferase CheR
LVDVHVKSFFEDSTRPQLEITVEEFVRFRDFFYQKTGVQFAESKRYFVDKRIAERARANDSQTFREYFMLLRLDRSGAELQQLINLLTVNETYFFRENYQLESLVRFVLPQIAARKARGDAIRIWSLPCSTGEEPYSIAISVLDAWARSDDFQIEISGSDVDTRVLADARAGLYGERSLQHVGAATRDRYFARRPGNQFQIIPELRESIDFFQLNISNKAEMSRFRNIDVIFCRNLLIYFDDLSRREAVESIFESLAPGGFVYLGHSESMSRMSSLFTPRRLGDCSVYQRPFEAGSRA